MAIDKPNLYREILFFIIFLILVIIVALLIKPFFGAIILSIVTAYMFFPVYLWLTTKIRFKHFNLSAVITILLVVVLVLIPVIFTTIQLKNEVILNYDKYFLPDKTSYFETCAQETFFCKSVNLFKQAIVNPSILAFIKESLSKLSSSLVSKITGILVQIPHLILGVIMYLVLTYYLLRDGKKLFDKLRTFVFPLSKRNEEHVIEKLKGTLHAIVYGHFVIAIMQGVIAVFSFTLLGFESPVLWGFLIGFLAFVPFLGASLVWVPAMIIEFYFGSFWSGIGVLIVGIIISLVEQIFKPMIIGEKADMHPAVMLLGVIGGVLIFGMTGVFIGPMVLVIFMIFVEILKTEYLSEFEKRG